MAAKSLLVWISNNMVSSIIRGGRVLGVCMWVGGVPKVVVLLAHRTMVYSQQATRVVYVYVCMCVCVCYVKGLVSIVYKM